MPRKIVFAGCFFFQSRVKISVDAKISLAKAAGNRGKPWDVNIYKKFL